MDTNLERVTLCSSTPASVRRKSIFAPNTHSPILSENNDDAERSAIRNELNCLQKQAAQISYNEKRRSLGLNFLSHMPAPEMSNRIAECIKLSAENKINAKNAFHLEIIDFMTYMIKKKDENMLNLQVASTSLDVSTKIYGFRVDGVHMDIMKLTSGLEKQQENAETADNQENNGAAEGETNQPEKASKKKKKRSKQTLLGTVENLKGNIEISKPTLWFMDDNDALTADSLFLASLPNHAQTKFNLHMYHDVIVDSLKSNDNVQADKEVDFPKYDFSGLQICPSIPEFDFLSAVDDDDDDDHNESVKETAADNFQFDLDASLPLDNETNHSAINCFADNESLHNIEECAAKDRPVEKIVDLCKAVTKTAAVKPLEYSFLHKNMHHHWAGPSHWKINHFAGSFGSSRIVEKCNQEKKRKTKEIKLVYDEESQKAVAPEYVIKKHKQTVLGRNWNESAIALPPDMHYNIETTTKLYFHKLVTVNLDDDNKLDATHFSDNCNYNYDSEHDRSNYCPNVPLGENDYDDGRDIGTADDQNVETAENFTDDNLVIIPKLTNKVSIPYSVRAKKIDMRQLKKSIWKHLISSANITNVDIQTAVEQETENTMTEEKSFSKIYKLLPDTLSKTNAEALSFPISFVSLLHLANEKTLKITSPAEMSDIIVTAS